MSSTMEWRNKTPLFSNRRIIIVFSDEVLFFFFSSRRRHTRLQGDWSSDVCSSDLGVLQTLCQFDWPPVFGRFRSAAPIDHAVASPGNKSNVAQAADGLGEPRRQQDRKSVV